jgi:Putative Ig domain
VRLQLHARPAAGQSGPVSFRALRLPVGLHINAASGVISGTVGRPGVRTVTVTALAASGIRGSIQFTWAVERRPRASAAFAGPAKMPALRITDRAGAFEPGLRQLIIVLPPSITLARSVDAVQVLSGTGRPLVHNAHYRGHVLTIKLALAQSPVRITFPSGSLRVSGRLAGPRRIAIGSVDRIGGHFTLHRALGRA